MLCVVKPANQDANHGTEEEGEEGKGGRGGGGGGTEVRPSLGDGVFAYQEADEALPQDEDGEAINKALDKPDHAIDKSSNEDGL